jgi:hypothetical protein
VEIAADRATVGLVSAILAALIQDAVSGIFIGKRTRLHERVTKGNDLVVLESNVGNRVGKVDAVMALLDVCIGRCFLYYKVRGGESVQVAAYSRHRIPS